MTIRQKHYAWMTMANKLEKERQDMYYMMKICSQNFTDPNSIKLNTLYPFNPPVK
jgi:hypothetical protein